MADVEHYRKPCKNIEIICFVSILYGGYSKGNNCCSSYGSGCYGNGDDPDSDFYDGKDSSQ